MCEISPNDRKTADINELNSNIEELTATISELTQDIADLAAAVKELDTAMAQETEERNQYCYEPSCQICLTSHNLRDLSCFHSRQDDHMGVRRINDIYIYISTYICSYI